MNTDPVNPSKRMDRRAAIKWMLAASATIPFLDTKTRAQSGPALNTPGGYGSDPNLIAPEIPWERTLTPAQLHTAAALSDLILPQDDQSPSASEVHIADFIDEWVSAPYPTQQKDREIVLEGFAWIDAEARKRFDKPFRQLDAAQQTNLCDDICYLPQARPPFEAGARFFAKYRDLTLGGYYTTDRGAKDVGYVGNVALATFDGPPPEVLEKLGIDATPW